MTIDPTIPPNPKQPDGTPFVPGGAKPQIVNFSYAGRAFTLTWTSVAGAAYTIEMSADLKSWTKLKSDHPSGGAQTSYTDDPPAPAPNFRFFRVLKE
jgi:hypothetical protein